VAPRSLMTVLVALGLMAGCAGKTIGASGSCRDNDDCGPGYFCIEDTCLPLCNVRTDCGSTEACVDGVCRTNTYKNCLDIPTCPTAQHCVESVGTADAYCAADTCDGIGVSTCAGPPNFVCIDGVCTDNPLQTCADLGSCNVGQRCEETNGLVPASCVAIDCTGVGQGTCPDPALECIAGKCARSRQPSGMTFAGGVSASTLSSTGYRLNAHVSPPESVASGGATYLLTSPSYRLEGGLTP
jgi:hypothetical protein